jgi:UDP-GlcNAc:undecaprenyl-phosphate/decaprenyl-phosphate GlcNAc-1-phosphate transferase
MDYLVNGHNIFVILFVTFLTSVLLVPLVKKIAIHVNAMDMPNERKVHQVPMPRMGGLAIFFSFMIGYMLYARESTMMLSVLIGSFLIILCGMVDDINSVKARYKFVVQIIAASIVCIYGNLTLNYISILGLNLHFIAPWDSFITVFFMVAIMNAMNLIDGLDGLAAGISSIYFITIAIIALILNQMGGLDVILSVIMAGATLGFLVHNFPPASIFMGDSGSLFLGYIIGVIALLGFKAATLTSIIIPICILAIPIFDTASAIIRRLLKGQKIDVPDKEHFHHQLLKMKFSQRTTILIIYGITILFSSVSIFYVLGDQKAAIIIYIILMFFLIFIVMKTDILFKHKKTKIKEENEAKEKVIKQHHLMDERAKKRRKNKKSAQ